MSKQVYQVVYESEDLLIQTLGFFRGAKVVDWIAYRDTLVFEVLKCERIKDPILDRWMKQNPISNRLGHLKAEDLGETELPGWGIRLNTIIEQVESTEDYLDQATKLCVEEVVRYFILSRSTTTPVIVTIPLSVSALVADALHHTIHFDDTILANRDEDIEVFQYLRSRGAI